MYNEIRRVVMGCFVMSRSFGCTVVPWFSPALRTLTIFWIRSIQDQRKGVTSMFGLEELFDLDGDNLIDADEEAAELAFLLAMDEDDPEEDF